MNNGGGNLLQQLPGAGLLDPDELPMAYYAAIWLVIAMANGISKCVAASAELSALRDLARCKEELETICAAPAKNNYNWFYIKCVVVLLWASLFVCLVLLTARCLTNWIGIRPRIGVVRGSTAARLRAWATRNNYGRLRAFIWHLEQWMVNGSPLPASILFVALLGGLCGAIMGAKILRFFPRFK